MAPDLNSLPPSRSITVQPLQTGTMSSSQISPHRQNTPSPRGSMSLAATATMNAADRSRRSSTSQTNRVSPQISRISSERRRSQVAMNLSLNDPSIPGPGELSAPEHRSSMANSFSAASPTSLGGSRMIATGDPHHQRQPSLGDIHNELEQEQEAQVNRMLQMIRAQQSQLETIQRAQQDNGQTPPTAQENAAINITAVAVDDGAPGPELSHSATRPSMISRNSSNATRSPALRPLPGHETFGSSGDYFAHSSPEPTRRNSIRDDSAFYQAETASLTRENQMLRHRIRELEKQFNELTSKQANSPPTSSNLAANATVHSPPESPLLESNR